MRKKSEKEHWAVIEPSYVSGPALVIIDSNTPSTIYWNGGPGYMTRAKYKILESVHVDLMTDEGIKALNKLELNMYQKYWKYDPATEPMRSEGWISPDGKVFYCNYGEHKEVAKILVAKYYNFLEQGNSEKFIEDKRWLKVYRDGMIINGQWDFKCTQAQIDAIGWLCTTPDAEPKWIEELKDHIKMFEVEE